MNLSALTIKRPVATIMILLIIIVLGISSVISIPMDLMPEIELPYVMVMTSYGGSSPEEVESMVTKPVEGALASVENLDGMMSYSMEGSSIVMLQFKFDTDMDFATLDMREKIAMISDYLPEGCSEPLILKLNMNMMPIAQVYVSSEAKELSQLTSMLEDNIVPRFERASGVATVDITGGLSKEVAIKFSQEELTSYGLTLATVSQLLAAENINLPSGNISKGDTEIIVRTIGEFDDVNDIAEMPFMISDRSIVRLGDIATITEDYEEQESISRINGETAIGIMISKQSDANTLDTSKNIRRTITALQAEYPELNFVVGYDSADYIKMSIKSVATAALFGAVLAIIVVFIFLRNIRATLIIGISIPTSLLAAFGIMNALDMTLNLITLCALTICVGMLVDNSIVVLENIFRVRQFTDDPNEAALIGSKEVLLAIIASTLTTMMVFVPIALSDGMASLLFADFCWTIIIALLASLVVAVTVIPMLFSKVMTGKITQTYMRIGKRRHKFKLLNKFADFIEDNTEKYGLLMEKVLKRRKKFIVSCICIFLVSMLLILTVGFEILPETDEGMVSVSVEMPYGTSLQDKDVIMAEVENYLLSLPEVQTVSMSTGSVSAMSLNDNGSISVIMKDRRDRNISSVELADKIEKDLSYITEANISAMSSSSISSMFGSHDVSFLIKGHDIEKLEEIGNDLVAQLESYEGVNDAALDVSEGSPEIKVIIDRNTAAYYGVTAYQLANGLSTAISGTTATHITLDGTEIDVNLSLNENIASSVEAMKQVLITGNYGTSVPVGQIATFEYGNSPSYIYHENQVNTITLNVDTDGASLTGGTSDVIEFVEGYPFPDGYYIDNSGSYAEMMDAFASLFKALLVAIALVFLLLAAQFESMLMSFVVMMAVPFAMSGAFIAMFLTGTALSLTSFLGLIMLVGIVVNNSILLVEFINQYKQKLGLHEALIQAGKLRLRPILMSCVTTVVGMIPLSLGFGEGGEILAPMAISIIGGLIASTIVTLFLIPTIYSIVEERKQRRIERKEHKEEEIRILQDAWAKEDAQ